MQLQLVAGTSEPWCPFLKPVSNFVQAGLEAAFEGTGQIVLRRAPTCPYCCVYFPWLVRWWQPLTAAKLALPSTGPQISPLRPNYQGSAMVFRSNRHQRGSHRQG